MAAEQKEERKMNWRPSKPQEKGWSSESLDEFDEYDGNEILFNINENDTIMGQIFYEKWRKVNSETMKLRSGKTDILTNLKMFGKYFPCKIRLVKGMSPPKLGMNFFERFGWRIDLEGNINSPL